MTQAIRPAPDLDRRPDDAGRAAAVLGALASVGAVFSAAACCVLPIGLAALGIGAGGLAAFEPLHWPMTIAALVAVGAGWFFHLRKRLACAADAGCATAAPKRATFVLLYLSSGFLALSALWPWIEAPLLAVLGG